MSSSPIISPIVSPIIIVLSSSIISPIISSVIVVDRLVLEISYITTPTLERPFLVESPKEEEPYNIFNIPITTPRR